MIMFTNPNPKIKKVDFVKSLNFESEHSLLQPCLLELNCFEKVVYNLESKNIARVYLTKLNTFYINVAT